MKGRVVKRDFVYTPKGKNRPLHIYLPAGYEWNRKIADFVESFDAKAMMYCHVGGGHCEKDWEKLVPKFMKFLWME